MNRLLFIPIALLAIPFVSCKSSTAGLQRATATSIGNTLSSEVIVSNVKRTATSASWSAKKNGECYECEADDMLRSVNCKKVECNN